MAIIAKQFTGYKKQTVPSENKHPRPENLKPVNRKARRAIKAGRKHSEKQSMEKSAAGSHD